MKKLNKKSCPHCGSSELVPIVYGYLPFDGLQKVEEGKMVFGGCVWESGMPEYRCRGCNRDLTREDIRSE